MTDAADEQSADTNTAEESAAPTAVDHLVELQRIDTDADQLANKRERLDERAAFGEASTALTAWERTRDAHTARLAELDGVIAKAEADGGELAEHKTRLEAQMKTVIAPREAEALMHEVATIDEQIDALDMTELEALEEQSDVDDTLTAHLGSEAAVRAATDAARVELERVTGEIDAQIEALASERDVARPLLSDPMLAKYDRVRASSGVAVASLSGHRCEGCHLDLSAAEIDDVKDEGAANDGVAECPNCGRMLAL